MIDLSSVRLKLARAEQHLDALQASLDGILEPHEDSGLRFSESEADGIDWELAVSVTEDPPLYWSIWIGEILYAVQSSLDHIAHTLIPESLHSSQTGFPIYADERNYRGDLPAKLPGVSAPYIAVFDDLQPFNVVPDAPRRATIWNIKELARLDRHRFLHTTDLWLTNCRIAVDPPGFAAIDFKAKLPCRVTSERAVIAYGRTVRPLDQPEVDVHFTADSAVDAVLPDLTKVRGAPAGSGARALSGIRAMVRHVNEGVVPMFEAVP